MATRNPTRRRSLGLLLAALALLAVPAYLAAETRLFTFTTSKGFIVKVLQDNEMPLVHAELQVFLDGGAQNYNSLAITQLTVMNMFDRSLNSPSSGLMDMLLRQGGDFQVDLGPECVTIAMNFLPDRLGSFSKLLREVFSYNSFHLNKFNDSKERFWSLFKKARDWKKEAAVFLAYQQLIGNFFFSQSFLMTDSLRAINLAQLRSFLLRTFRPDNAQLILKGKINPYYTLGMIEKDLPPLPSVPLRARKEEAARNFDRRLFILNVNSADLPTVYWFDVAPAGDPISFVPYAIGNFVLFGFPGGRIYQSERNRSLMGGYKVNTDVLPFKGFTLFCNSLRLNYGDLENLLIMVDQERRRFSVRPVERKEYLDALHFYVGQGQVDSSRFDHDLQGEISRFRGQGTTSTASRISPELFQEVSFGQVAQTIDEQMGNRHRNGLRERGIIVLVGNADLILSSLKSLKTEALELSLD